MTTGDSPQPASPSPEPPPSLAGATDVVDESARPIRFFHLVGSEKFRITPEALTFLHQLEGPVAVVSICGHEGQGKSFILNQLIGRRTQTYGKGSGGFKVKDTCKPCTKGFWLWGAPLKRTADDGTKYNILFLDTEGINRRDHMPEYCTKIFSLAVLLSSMFIYNQMGGIDEAALNRLSLLTDMTKHVHLGSSEESSTASELGQLSPIFVWLLRDFCLDLVEENREITPRDYLELALRSVEGGGRDVNAENEIRESIRALFPDRECFTVAPPTKNYFHNQRVDKFPLDRLTPDYRSGLADLTKLVFERTQPKHVGNIVMTGSILAKITQSFLDALNKGSAPVIIPSWQSALAAEACEDATHTAVVAAPEDATHTAVVAAQEDAADKSVPPFNEIAVWTVPTREISEKRFQTFIKTAFEVIVKDVVYEGFCYFSNPMHKTKRD